MTRHLLITATLTAILSTSAAEGADPVVYQRNRQYPLVDAAYPGDAGFYAWHGGPIYGAPTYSWFVPQYFYGVWYQRPYPHHFDYYRWRYSLPSDQSMGLECPECGPADGGLP